MARWIRRILLCLAVLLFGLAGPTPAAVIQIAAPKTALTFVRVGAGVVLVTEIDDDSIKGVNLSCSLGRPVADPISVFLAEGYRKLEGLVSPPDPECILASRLADLTIPVKLTSHHIAAGTNFPEHAGESEVEGGPFLFAKLVAPTAFDAVVPVGEGLLDYEVELAWVALQPIHKGERPEWMGLILCNDYTDREALLRHVDVADVESGKGFSTGKSSPGYLPVGNLFVIPADYREFADAVELRLDVNGKTRQRGRVSDAIWNIDEMIEQVWEWQDRRWVFQGKPVSLLRERDVIDARTMLMGGTPSGTAFQGIPLGTRVSGLGAWILGGWSRSIVDNVVDAYAAQARKEKRFLQPGDRVVIEVDRLGTIENRIGDSEP